MTWSLELDPATNSRIDIRLFRDVKNTKQIRDRLFKGELNCCIIKPSLIVDPFQVAVAANKALVSEQLTTKTIFTEIAFNLSISKNITNSLEVFGISENDTDLLVACICNLSENGSSLDFIEGSEVSIDELKELTDMETVKKIYKISDLELKSINVLDSLVTRIAAK